MEKKIITVAYELPGHSDLHCKFSSNQSLMDGDIVILEPSLDEYELDYPNHVYQGKPCYSKDSSFRLKEDSEHWRREILSALETGKTVFVFLKKFEQVFIHTGKSEQSGTGRTAQIKNIVTTFNNFSFLPISLKNIVPGSGREIRFLGDPVFSTYWERFKHHQKYETYLDNAVDRQIFVTKTGEKTVGAAFQLGKGNLILLPVLEYDEKQFIKRDSRSGNSVWTKDAIKFGKSLLNEFVQIDKALRRGGEITPPPNWSTSSEYELASESSLKTKVASIAKQIESLNQEKERLINAVELEAQLKQLLYEKGKALENSIAIGLRILGYNTENFNDGSLELDHVISSPEGDRYIGEAEGKDNSAISIEKFRQLMSNIHEDLQREEVQTPALGVLFGNGFRLKNPDERDEQFTTKCINTAKSTNIALVRTPDLFVVSKFVKESGDDNFAAKCREAIKSSSGRIVNFPGIPGSK